MKSNLIRVLERTDKDDLKTLCDIITFGKNGTPRISDSLVPKLKATNETIFSGCLL